jgi:hypothetical protein
MPRHETRNEAWLRREKKGLPSGIAILAAGVVGTGFYLFARTGESIPEFRNDPDGLVSTAGLIGLGCMVIGLNAVVRGLMAVVQDRRTKDDVP